jgi:integrase
MRKKKGRARDGEGTPEQLPSGLFRYVTKLKTGTVKGPAKPTKDEARVALAEKLRSLNDESEARPRMSFGTMAKSWTESRTDAAPSTRDTWRYWSNSLSSDPLSKIPAIEITAADLTAWWRRSKLKPITKGKRVGWFRQVLRDNGIRVEWTAPKSDKHNPRRPLNEEERTALLGALATLPNDLRLAILLCWYVGLRRSEACGLMHSDRDGDGVRIRRTVTYSDGALRVRMKGKTGASLAWVPLAPALRELVGPPRVGFVLTGDPKTPMNPKVLSNRLHEVLKPILPRVPRLGTHALRRTFGTMLLEAGTDVVTAAKAMRHDPATLLREYARSRDDLTKKAVDDVFSAPLPPLTTPTETKRNPE